MAKLVEQTEGSEFSSEREVRSFSYRPADCDLADLIHSWGRLGDPRLQRLAIRFIRMLGQGTTEEQENHFKLT